MRDTDESIAADTVSPAIQGPVAETVAAHLQRVTRFSRCDVVHLVEEQAIALPVTLEVEQSIEFDAVQHAGAQRLPDGIVMLHGAFSLSTKMHQAVHLACAQAAEAVQRWVDADPASYRRLMPPEAAFLTPPKCYGYEHTCATCVGLSQVGCEVCGGQGENACGDCGGSGKKACAVCAGARRLQCATCAGRGSCDEIVATQRWDAASGVYVTEQLSAPHACADCAGSGQITCRVCNLAGKVTCTGCAGGGKVTCAACHADGMVACGACVGSGVQHTWACVQARVEVRETLDVDTDDAILRALVQDKIALAALPEYGALLDTTHTGMERMFSSCYRLRLDVLKAPLRAAGRRFEVYGFGPQATVFDFVNIAGHLLEDDLADLEHRNAQAALWHPRHASALIESTQHFIGSELNRIVAEQLADQKISQVQAVARIEQQFHGLVGAAYVARSSCALRQALGSVYTAEVSVPAAAVCALVLVAASLMYALGWPYEGAVGAIGCGAMLGLMAWGVLEWHTRRRLGACFPGAIGERLLQRMCDNGTVRRWRGGAALSMLLLMGGGIFLTANVPWVERSHLQKMTRLHGEQALAAWQDPATADLRQRRYPPAGLLRDLVAQGEHRARLMLAWQLLLGAGVERDVDGAAGLLATVPTAAEGDALWQGARAVLAYQQARKPAQWRAATDLLAQLAEGGLVEARYWEARAYFDEQSPLRNTRLGLEKMTLAADAGHAHAAFELAKLYAKGKDGIKRDMGKARNYLALARKQGLAESRLR